MPVKKTIKPEPNGRISSIPDEAIAREYVHRVIGATYDFDVFDTALHGAMNVLLSGPTGPGKTMATMAYAAERGMHFFAVPSNVGIDPSQIIGRFVPDPETGKFKFANGGVTDIAEHGGVLLINEVNFLPDRIATAIFGFLDNRREVAVLERGERVVVRAHRPDCWCDLPAKKCEERWVLIVADMNPDYGGTRPLNVALRNRFAIQLNWDYDPNVEKKLVRSTELLEFAKEVRRAAAAYGSFTTPVSTNMLMEFERIVVTLGYDFAKLNFMAHFPHEAERAAIDIVLKARDMNLRGAFRKQEKLHPVVAPIRGIAKVPDSINAGTGEDEYKDWHDDDWMDG